jgi:predicted DNA-binding WGR domain protein
MAKSATDPVTRLEFSEGTSSKFWEVRQSGKTLQMSWGRIGTAGQGQTKTFASPDAARAELEKLVAAKRQKGYAEAGRRAATARSKPARAATSTRTAAAPPPPPSAEPPRLPYRSPELVRVRS